MANTFKSITSADMSSAGVTIYTTPASTQTIVIGFHISNKHTSAITIDVQASGVYLAKDVSIATGTTFVPIEGKLVLEATETVVVTPSVTTVSDAHMSILEITA